MLVREDTVANIHAMDFDDVFVEGTEMATVVVAKPTTAALVLGSAQPVSPEVEGRARRLGMDLVRRRSGGGAVTVVPGDVTWLDIWIPSDDHRWVDDVGVAMHWVGERWASAAAMLGIDAAVHRGPMLGGDLARQVCFAGVGPGEVLVEGRKLVGISQRRGRSGARFQCSWVRRWNPEPLVQILGLTDDEHIRRVEECAHAAPVDPDALVEGFVDER